MRQALVFCLMVMSLAGAQTNTPPGFALVLSGGGARGLSQIGVLRALEEEGLRPSMIVGNSMGAIIGSLYACGYSPDSIEAFCYELDWNTVFDNSAQRTSLLVSQKDELIDYQAEARFDYDLSPVVPGGLSRGQIFYRFLAPKLAAPQFHAQFNWDDLAIPLRLVCTDICNGVPVVLSQGDLTTGVRASSCIPLAFTPVTWDTLLLVDGGTVDNIPTDIARKEGFRRVIAIDVTSPIRPKTDLDNPLRIADQIVSIGMLQQKAAALKLADYTITPELEGIYNTSFNMIDSSIHLGYRAARKAIPALKALLGDMQQSALKHPTDSLPLPIHWEGCDTSYMRVLDSSLSYLQPATVSISHIAQLVQAAYSRRGMPFATVDKFYFVGCTSHVRIDPGIIQDIAIAGAVRTSSAYIQKVVPLRKGTLLTSNGIAASIEALYSLDLFDNVNIFMDNNRILRIELLEKKFLRARAAIRFDEFHLLEGYIEPAYENFFGLGLVLQSHLQYGLRRERYTIDIIGNFPISGYIAHANRLQAYIAREKIVSRIKTIDSTISIPDTSFVERYSLEEQSLSKAGICIAIGTEIGRWGMLEGVARLEKYRLYLSDNSVVANLTTSFPKELRSISGRLIIDNLDRFPFPRSGQKDYFSATLGTGSQPDTATAGLTNFIKIDGSISSFFTIRNLHTIATRLQFGWANSTLAESERFYMGGSLPDKKFRDIEVFNYVSFQGLAPRSVPCDIQFVISGEYRYAINRTTNLSFIANYGTFWNQNDFEWNWDTIQQAVQEKGPLGIGAELSTMTLAGPARAGWGRLLTNTSGNFRKLPEDNIFYISLGHDF